MLISFALQKSKNYPQGKSMAFEGRPIDIYTNGDIKIYEIDSTEHANHYDFEDLDDIIDNFLLNFHSKCALLKQEMVVKYDFKLQNIQPPLLFLQFL